MKRYKKEIVKAIIGFFAGILSFYLTNQIYESREHLRLDESWAVKYIPFLLVLSPIR